MTTLVQTFFAFLVSCFRSRAVLQIENTMLRHQLNVYGRRQAKPRLRPMDRFLWAWVSRIWPGWQRVLTLCKPATVIAWRRKRFRDYWAALSRKEGPGRPPLPKEVQDLIKQLSSRNIGWGVPRIVGELGKLGIHIAKSTVEKYRVKHPKSPSPTWKSFRANHLTNLVAIDFFIVPTIDFRVLYVLVVLAHHRRELVYFMPIRFAPKATTHSGQGFARRLPVGVLGVNRIGMVYFNVTAHPTAQWVGQQMVEAFPWDTAPKYLLRDRDATYGEGFRRRVQSLLIKEVIMAPRSPWQNAYVERIIGSIRRDCLDHIIVFDERHLNRILKNYFEYYHRWRTHLGLEMDTPQGREVQAPHQGKILEMPDLGGLHHHYVRLAA